MPEAVFTGPMIAMGGESFADASRRPRPVLGVDLVLPEADILARRGTVVAEQGFQTLRPGKRAGSYIPIPNSVIRSPGNNLKMFRAFRRAAFRNLIMRFMFLGGTPGSWILDSSWISGGCFVFLNFGR